MDKDDHKDLIKSQYLDKLEVRPSRLQVLRTSDLKPMPLIGIDREPREVLGNGGTNSRLGPT